MERTRGESKVCLARKGRPERVWGEGKRFVRPYPMGERLCVRPQAQKQKGGAVLDGRRKKHPKGRRNRVREVKVRKARSGSGLGPHKG